MSYQMSSGAPSWRSSSSSQIGAGDYRLSASRLQSLRSGLDLPAMKSVMDSSLSSMRSGLDSLLQNNHQEVMQELNERLAGYLQRVRGLEEENRKLQEEIEDISAKKNPASRDWETYQSPLQQLRKQVRPSTKFLICLGKTWSGWNLRLLGLGAKPVPAKANGGADQHIS